MFLAMGWAIIQSSRAPYHEPDFDAGGETGDEVDERLQVQDQILFAELRKWIEDRGDPWFKWQFTEHLNNHSGMLQFHTSRNHSPQTILDLLDFLANQSKGSHGVVYTHNDEVPDPDTDTDEFGLSYRVIRLLDGEVTHHKDDLFSPFKSRDAFEFV